MYFILNYNSGGVEKKQIIQFVNKKILDKLIFWGKKFNKKRLTKNILTACNKKIKKK